jgi:hypothetical protein
MHGRSLCLEQMTIERGDALALKKGLKKGRRQTGQ